MEKLFENWRAYQGELLTEASRPRVGESASNIIINNIIDTLKKRPDLFNSGPKSGWFNSIVITKDDMIQGRASSSLGPRRGKGPRVRTPRSGQTARNIFKKFPLLDQVEIKIDVSKYADVGRDGHMSVHGSASPRGVVDKYSPKKEINPLKPRPPAPVGKLTINIEVSLSAYRDLGHAGFFKKLRNHLRGADPASRLINVLTHELVHFRQGEKGTLRPGPGSAPFTKDVGTPKTGVVRKITSKTTPGGKVVYELIPDEFESNFRAAVHRLKDMKKKPDKALPTFREIFLNFIDRAIEEEARNFKPYDKNARETIRKNALKQAEEYAKRQFPKLLPEFSRSSINKLGQAASRAAGPALGIGLLSLDLYLRLEFAETEEEKKQAVIQWGIDLGIWTAIGAASIAASGMASPGILAGMVVSCLIDPACKPPKSRKEKYRDKLEDEEAAQRAAERSGYKVNPKGFVPGMRAGSTIANPIKENKKSVRKINILLG